MPFCGRLSESRISVVWSLKGPLYRAAHSGPLREDTRREVKNMLSACLVALRRSENWLFSR